MKYRTVFPSSTFVRSREKRKPISFIGGRKVCIIDYIIKGFVKFTVANAILILAIMLFPVF